MLSLMMIYLPAAVLGYNGKATFYNNPNHAPGSCGFGFSDSEFIAALSGDMMTGYKSSNCNKMARVGYKGKTITVKIVDTCPTCEHTSLDLSPAAFKALEHPDVGLIDITWDFIDGNVAQTKQGRVDNGKSVSKQNSDKTNPSNINESSQMHEGPILWTANPDRKGGRCGVPFSDNDLVVVISNKFFETSKCGEWITVQANDKKVKVQVVDSCQGCEPNSILLSKSAFKVFHDLKKGKFVGKWGFIGSKNTDKTSYSYGINAGKAGIITAPNAGIINADLPGILLTLIFSLCI